MKGYPCGHVFAGDDLPQRCPFCAKVPRRHKYGAKPVDDKKHGHFDSTGEYLRYLDLLQLRRNKVIKCLARQVTYWIESIKQSAKWDFRYKELIDGRWKTVVEDYKGVKTRTYRHKRKWFEHDYPEIVFRETTQASLRKRVRGPWARKRRF